MAVGKAREDLAIGYKLRRFVAPCDQSRGPCWNSSCRALGPAGGPTARLHLAFKFRHCALGAYCAIDTPAMSLLS